MSLNLIKMLAKCGEIPKPLDRIGTGNPLFDLTDRKMVEFVELWETPRDSGPIDPDMIIG